MCDVCFPLSLSIALLLSTSSFPLPCRPLSGGSPKLCPVQDETRHFVGKVAAHQCLQDVLLDFGCSDAIDDGVEAAREQWVHGAEEDPAAGREAVSYPVRQERNESHTQGDHDDHNMGDTGVNRLHARRP